MAEAELWDYDRLVDTSKLVISQTVGTRGGQCRGDVKSSVPNRLLIVQAYGGMRSIFIIHLSSQCNFSISLCYLPPSREAACFLEKNLQDIMRREERPAQIFLNVQCVM